MKVITLTPVKNEAWILPYSLKNFSSFSDHIIIADQQSSDETINICKTFEKVRVINNPYTKHTNQIRWLLLDEARKIKGNNLIIYLDADEFLSQETILELKKISLLYPQGTQFSANWIQLLHSLTTYRVDGVWKKANHKNFAFLDDRKLDYNRAIITNDHSNRIPDGNTIIPLNLPIIHVQYLAEKKCELKQILYRCNELLHGRDARRINYRYAVSDFSKKTATENVKPSWISGIEFPSSEIFDEDDFIKKEQIYRLFQNKGVLSFEDLDIWNNDEFRQYFIDCIGRPPVSKHYPKIIRVANDLKNFIKNAILKKV